VTELNVDSAGHLDLDELKGEISGDTALVSVMWANNETGVIHPVGAIGDLAKQFGALVHVDAAQAAGKLKLDLAEEPAVDFLTISAHKFHGLKGCGALFVREGTGFEPLIRGGHHETGRRAGTENTLGIVALGAAADLARRKLDAHIEHMRKMRDRLERGLMAKCDDVTLNGDPVSRLPNTTNLGFACVDGEALLMMMDAENICATAGSACRSGSMEPSHVLKAMNVPLWAIHGSVRFCVSRYTTEDEVDALVEKVSAIVRRLREISPFGARSAPRQPTDAELEAHKAYFARA
jgi:cysteine desulfurase